MPPRVDAGVGVVRCFLGEQKSATTALLPAAAD